jgi:hypothetical protein
MSDPIEVNYVPDGDDWQVTVSGRGQLLRARAPGLIAARDRADQLVEKVAPEDKLRRVVHLLDGDALEFTAAYLTARLAKPAEPAAATAAPSAAEEPAKPIPAPAPRKDSDEPTRAGAKHGATGDD